MNLVKSNDDWIVEDCSMAFGGMGPTTVRPLNTIKNIIGSSWSSLELNEINGNLISDFNMPFSAPGGQVEFRKTCIAHLT